jgi:hypothetical protein
MLNLENYTAHLKPGLSEICVRKVWPAEQLKGWEKDDFYLPRGGSRASYRKEELHAHDFGDRYCVHRDHVDCRKDPIGHLVLDAPIVLFAGLVLLSIIGLVFVATRRN